MAERATMKRIGFARKIPAPVLPEQRQKPQKKCAVKTCRALFTPRTITHKACSPECALIIAEDVRKKKERKEYKDRKEKLKSRSDLVKNAQIAFNRFINLRDQGKVCCACGKHYSGISHASHYLSVGARPNLRFNEDNCHSGCQKCNVFLHGNLINYRINLIARIGVFRVERLENDTSIKKFTHDEIISITREYQLKCKELKNIVG